MTLCPATGWKLNKSDSPATIIQRRHSLLSIEQDLICSHFSRERAATRLAQSEERSTFNRVVVGSIPTSGGA